MNDFLNDNDDLPTPPQPPHFYTCSAPPGSQEWLTYWATQANEAVEYNKRIHAYGLQMLEWTKSRTGVCLAAARKAASVYTTSQQLLDKTSSNALDAEDTLENSEFKNTPLNSLENEESNRTELKYSDENDNSVDENKIPSKSKENSINASESTKSASQFQENKISEDKIDDNNSEKPIEETEENAFSIRESTLVEALQQNMDTRIAGMMSTIYEGFTGLLHNIKEGLSTAIFDSADNENPKVVTIETPVPKEKWFETSDSSRTISEVPILQENPDEDSSLNLDSRASIETVYGLQGSETCPTISDATGAKTSFKEKQPQKYNLIKASMELGAFEINTTKVSSKNGCGVPSGITCRILGFSFKRISTKDYTKLIFIETPSESNESCVEVIPRLGVREERNFLEVKAARNGCVEVLCVLLPYNAIFENIKIEKLSGKVSVMIPFHDLISSNSSLLEKYYR